MYKYLGLLIFIPIILPLWWSGI